MKSFLLLFARVVVEKTVQAEDPETYADHPRSFVSPNACDEPLFQTTYIFQTVFCFFFFFYTLFDTLYPRAIIEITRRKPAISRE